MHRLFLSSGLISAILAIPAECNQDLDHGPEYSSTFAAQAIALPDIDGDGVPEIVVADPGFAGAAMWFFRRGERGAVWLVSGKSGAVIWRLCSPEVDDGFGVALSVADGSLGDGCPDLLIGTNVQRPGRSGRVYRAPRGATGFGRRLSDEKACGPDGARVFLTASRYQDLNKEREAAVLLVASESGAVVSTLGVVRHDPFVRGQFGWCPDVNGDSLYDVYCVRNLGKESGVLEFRSALSGQLLDGWGIPGLRMAGSYSSLGTRELNGMWLRLNDEIQLRDHQGGASTFGISPHAYGGVAVVRGDADGSNPALVYGDAAWALGNGRVIVSALERDSGDVESGPPMARSEYGAQLANCRDVDGDDYDDFIVLEDARESHGHGRLWLVSGMSGQPLYYLQRQVDADEEIIVGRLE